MTTQPDITWHIDFRIFGTTPEADCRLCGAHTSGAGIHGADDVHAWADDHAATCTPETVRTRADHYRDAAQLIADHIDGGTGDGTDWDDPAIAAAASNLREHLRETAYRLENAADDETAAASSGSVAGAREDGPS